ncbi:MAG: D-cysteine desulfhydrase family protein [Microthrixaceae bacterium]|nr:D-cysteine desulfhydrase family protein [Microthrixaceae bacterium]
MPVRALDAIPRAGLGHWPTPLQRCDRLRAALGGLGSCPEIWVKREDCSGVAFGGNKVRKLDLILGEAARGDLDVVITFGAVQSNHCRQTAAACNMLGIDCELVLAKIVPRHDELYEHGGNVLLDHLLGATLHLVDDAIAGLELLHERQSELEAAGRRVLSVPFGGSDLMGTLGYVVATEEWARQAAGVGLAGGFDRVVLATSTGGTYAGTLLGVKRRGLPTHVTGISAYGDAASAELGIVGLMAAAATELGIGPPDPRLVEVRDEFLGGGYGILTDGVIEAVRLFAQTESLLLDPVYSGKAGAGLISLIRSGEIAASERVLFIHTGGGPGLFAYGDAILGREAFSP